MVHQGERYRPNAHLAEPGRAGLPVVGPALDERGVPGRHALILAWVPIPPSQHAVTP